VAPGFAGDPLPGAAPFDGALVGRLRAAWAARPAGYEPRTRHRTPDGAPRFTNRLFLESSPYLRQHAHNPVNWYPWGDEAFEEARRSHRPVLLSIGYSTCHWCHVMEEESFEDEEIARVLNESYVAIKVDREVLPDVDATYMKAVQALTGNGGWPMTVWLTPERRPFYGGTYFPARDGDRGERAGFLTILETVRTAYDEHPDRVTESAAGLTESIARSAAAAPAGALPGERVLTAAAALYRDSFDPAAGGTKRAPKFPSDLPVRFLLRHHRRTGDAGSLLMATRTLEAMAAGGIHDQVGGGFHRYSTDARWLVPHFEKMLYDNALLAIAYLEGYQATGRADFAAVVVDILDYVARDMTSPEGAFYSATDADSPAPGGGREEGLFFTWTPLEIEAALGAAEARLALRYWDVTPAGDFAGRSILHAPRPLAAVANDLGVPLADAQASIEEARGRLRAVRAERPPPLRDEKILAAWNGLMISAHAQAALALGEERWAERAARAADWILTHMRTDGRLRRSAGDSGRDGYLDDYAFLAAGLVDLYEASGDPRWLREAIALDATLAAHYEDTEHGGFYLTGDEYATPLARDKPGHDGAEPSGNSVHARTLLRLYELTGDERYRERAEATLRAFGESLERTPASLAEMLLALDWRLDAPFEIVIVTQGSRAEAGDLLARAGATFVPNRVLVVAAEGSDLTAQSALVPLLGDKSARGGRATAYVCVRRVCRLPTTDPAELARQLAPGIAR
jgi:hypothetical protein